MSTKEIDGQTYDTEDLDCNGNLYVDAIPYYTHQEIVNWFDGLVKKVQEISQSSPKNNGK